MDGKREQKKYVKLNPEQSLKLIEQVKQYPELWCKSNKHYRNTQRQESAWLRLSPELSISANDAKNNWRALLANFRVYRARIKTSQVTGSDDDDIYRPRWFAYESMLFVTESSDVVETMDTIGLARPTSHGPTHQPTQSTVKLEVPCSSQNCSPVSPFPSRFSVNNDDTPRVASTTRQRRKRAHDNNEDELTASLQALVHTINRHMALSGIATDIANWIDNFESRHQTLVIGKLYQAMHSIEMEINERNETTAYQ